MQQNKRLLLLSLHFAVYMFTLKSLMLPVSAN